PRRGRGNHRPGHRSRLLHGGIVDEENLDRDSGELIIDVDYHSARVGQSEHLERGGLGQTNAESQRALEVTGGTDLDEIGQGIGPTERTVRDLTLVVMPNRDGEADL